MTPPENPMPVVFVTAALMTMVILGLIFREHAAKVLKLVAGVIWRVAIIPLGVAVPAVGWWLVLVIGEETGWWTPAPMPPSIDVDSFCLWTAVGLVSYLSIGRTVRVVGDAVRAAWKDAQPEPEHRRDSGGGGADSGHISMAVHFRALEARIRVLETKVSANTKSLATRSKNQAKVKHRLDDLEARLNLLKGDAPNDGEEV